MHRIAVCVVFVLSNFRCVAEASGVFFYVLPGIAAIAAFTVSKANAGYGSIFAIGKT